MSLNDVPQSASTSESPHWQQLDSNSLDAILGSRQGLESVSRLHGEDAVAIVGVLDQALDSVDLDDVKRKMYAFLLRKLCGRCGILPKSYILTDGLKIASHHPCASGGFGDVSEGQYTGIPVAIKRLRMCASDNILKANKRFCNEVVIWKHLCHPNVLPFLGVSAPPFPSCIVSLWMPHGNIVTYVKANPSVNRLALLSDVARGLHYLHSMDLVHGDLKGANILIKQDFCACLADFGLMRIVSDSQDQYSAITSENSKGTERWMAPELLSPYVFDASPSKECDVYAMAMVIFEAMTGNIPFHQYRNPQVPLLVVNGVRPDRPTMAGLSDSLWQLVELCWHQQLNERPPIDLVLVHLTEASQCWDPPSSTTELFDSDVDVDSDASNVTLDSPVPAELQTLWRLPTQDNTPMIIKYSSPHEIPEVITNGSRTTTQDNSVNMPSVRPTPAQSLNPSHRPFTGLSRSPTSGLPLDLKQPGKKKRSFWSLRGTRTKRSHGNTKGRRSQKIPMKLMSFFRRLLPRRRNVRRAYSLIEKFIHTHKFEDLEEAISCCRKALDLCPPGDSGRCNLLDALTFIVDERFRWTHKLEDLEEMIVYSREAVDLRPPGDPSRSSSLNCLAIYIHRRFRRTHESEDLEEAIVYSCESLNLCPPENPDRWNLLDTLAGTIHSRFKQTHKLEDLEEAIMFSHESLDLCPPWNFARSCVLDTLAGITHSHFKRTHKLDDLEEAISYHRQALDLRPPGNPGRSESLNNLAIVIHDRFKRIHKLEDLEEAIACDREALELRPPGDPDRSTSLYNLALGLHDYFRQTHKVEYLEEAINYHSQALDLRPPGNPDRSLSLKNHYHAIRDRFEGSQKLEDWHEAAELLTGAAVTVLLYQTEH